MKCISLWQPWASLIAIGAKTFETRSWATSYRGPLLIHAAKKRDGESLHMCLKPPVGDEHINKALRAAGMLTIGDLPFGAIIAACILEDCYRVGGEGMRSSRGVIRVLPEYPELAFGDYSYGRYAWKLTNVSKFNNPFPYKGMQQLFDVPEINISAETLKNQR